MTGKRLILAALALALAQLGFLTWIIAGRAAVLRNGQEVLLKVEPVDPRDLLRGDYVYLNYEIRNVQVALISNKPAGAVVTEEGPIYLRLGRDGDGFWRARSASLGERPQTPPADGEVDLRAELAGGWSLEPGGSLSVSLGIDRYYLPEGEGLAIEKDMRVRPFGILAAVGSDGAPHVKALMDGETQLFTEPPY